MTPPLLLLDISRLLGRGQRGAPTGIDRVEHAYAEQLLLQAPDRLHFVAIDKFDRLCTLPKGAATAFVGMIGKHWRGAGGSAAEIGAAARMLWVKALLRPALRLRARATGHPFYLLISHRHLHRPDRLRRAMAASQARLVAFVHDLIPIEYPEYGRPQQAELHVRRVKAVATMAEAVVVNSAATALALRPFLEAAGRAPPVLVAPLGVQPGSVGQDRAIAGPYFVYLSTIEPRKNHLMLLHVWRRLAEMLGDSTPHLVLVGRRGWENENVVDMLERSVAIRQHVTEWSEITDGKIGALLHHSRALLFPSFAEGFGLPVAEALAAGVPVICSDLPALRETGGDVPDYLDPLDGLGWLEAILHYAAPEAPARDAQIARMAGWTPPNWPDHVRSVVAFLAALPESAAA
jgi:glycosyltransferase involved in cell wall biosynthesis